MLLASTESIWHQKQKAGSSIKVVRSRIRTVRSSIIIVASKLEAMTGGRPIRSNFIRRKINIVRSEIKRLEANWKQTLAAGRPEAISPEAKS